MNKVNEYSGTCLPFSYLVITDVITTRNNNFLNLGSLVHVSTTVLKITSFSFHPSSAFLSEYCGTTTSFYQLYVLHFSSNSKANKQNECYE